MEVQVTTAFLAAISRVSHHLLYGAEPPSDVVTELERLAGEALRLDELVAALAGYKD